MAAESKSPSAVSGETTGGMTPEKWGMWRFRQQGEILKWFQRSDYAPWGRRIQHFPGGNWRWQKILRFSESRCGAKFRCGWSRLAFNSSSNLAKSAFWTNRTEILRGLSRTWQQAGENWKSGMRAMVCQARETVGRRWPNRSPNFDLQHASDCSRGRKFE